MNSKIEFEDVILDILKERPASAETISVITGMPTNYVLMKLQRMRRWGFVEKVTKKEVIMWGVPRSSKNN